MDPRRECLPCTCVEAFVSIWVCVALQQLALSCAQGLVDGHPIVAHSGEDDRLVGAQVMVHAYTK